jgi:hypothetical protein
VNRVPGFAVNIRTRPGRTITLATSGCLEQPAGGLAYPARSMQCSGGAAAPRGPTKAPQQRRRNWPTGEPPWMESAIA